MLSGTAVPVAIVAAGVAATFGACSEPVHVPATILAAVVLNAALIGVLAHQSLASPSSSAASPTAYKVA